MDRRPARTFLEEEQARTLEYFRGARGCLSTIAASGHSSALFHNRQRPRAQDYQEFVSFWEQLQAQGVWEGLRETLDDPERADEENLRRAGNEQLSPGMAHRLNRPATSSPIPSA